MMDDVSKPEMTYPRYLDKIRDILATTLGVPAELFVEKRINSNYIGANNQQRKR